MGINSARLLWDADKRTLVSEKDTVVHTRAPRLIIQLINYYCSSAHWLSVGSKIVLVLTLSKGEGGVFMKRAHSTAVP